MNSISEPALKDVGYSLIANDKARQHEMTCNRGVASLVAMHSRNEIGYADLKGLVKDRINAVVLRNRVRQIADATCILLDARDEALQLHQALIVKTFLHQKRTPHAAFAPPRPDVSVAAKLV